MARSSAVLVRLLYIVMLSQLEAIVEELDDVARSFTAACAVRTADRTTEELALFFVLAPGADRAAAAQRIRAKCCAMPGSIPHT